ncbi:trypsin 5G1-like [Neocloeon triangulifer]|uniref:trypsin 5G1-like n=1 Tax=Neocloeon triangulifer TaxID=2078957 RepID=UPI00286EE9FD|nr:trypsin 5G1-like [Neocloeon triangulifer]
MRPGLALKIFSLSSIGTRYFKDSQAGIITDHGIQVPRRPPPVDIDLTANSRQLHNVEWHTKHNIPLPPQSSNKSINTTKPTNCNCTCGVKQDAFKVDDPGEPQFRILGGREAHLHEYPWIVRMAEKGRTFCGGALISAEYVLTAAHCLTNRRKENVQVVIGDHDQTINSETIHTMMRPLSQIHVHKQYNAQTHVNDIALLKLRKPVKFNEGIQPACLPSSATLDPPARMGEIAGWGRTMEKGMGSDRILRVEVPLLSQKECRMMMIGPEKITDEMLCAGAKNKDSCQDDSGGPLIVQNPKKGKHEVHGIISWGYGCGREGFPGIYARVSKFIDWLKSKMPNACLCT